MHNKLKGVLTEHSIGLDYLASKTGRSKSSLSLRMRGLYPWDLDTVLIICDLCDIPHTQIPQFFERSKKK